MSEAIETVDNALGLCQQVHSSETVSLLGETGVVGTQCEISPEIKLWGGKRSGAGRKPKPAVIPVYAEPALRWYCVRTEYGAENDVDVAIRNAGFETFYPLLWVPPVAARRSEAGRAIPATSERMIPLLPRYLMVRFDRSLPDWRHICTMRGVERLFSTHPERPIPIPQRDIDALRITLAPNGALYPMAVAVTVGAKRKWTNMVEALKSLQDVAA